jgi:hypothetical protein
MVKDGISQRVLPGPCESRYGDNDVLHG